MKKTAGDLANAINDAIREHSEDLSFVEVIGTLHLVADDYSDRCRNPKPNEELTGPKEV